VNAKIRSPTVRLIGKDGRQIGILPKWKAIQIAKLDDLDLVEISPNTSPPVCKIMDYGKYKYEGMKKERLARKHQHITQIKEIKLRPKIEEHDFQVKLKHTRGFLENRNKVKIILRFRGREMLHKEFGREILTRMIEELNSVAVVEHPMKIEGKNMVLTLAPKR